MIDRPAPDLGAGHQPHQIGKPTEMPKTTYIATAPDGTEITRTSKTRIYTHAVLCHVQASERTAAHWGLISFNSREDLAVQEMNRWGGPAGRTCIDGEVWDAIRVVDVHQAERIAR